MRPIDWLYFLVPLLSSAAFVAVSRASRRAGRRHWCVQRAAGGGLNPERGRGAGLPGPGERVQVRAGHVVIYRHRDDRADPVDSCGGHASIRSRARHAAGRRLDQDPGRRRSG